MMIRGRAGRDPARPRTMSQPGATEPISSLRALH